MMVRLGIIRLGKGMSCLACAGALMVLPLPAQAQQSAWSPPRTPDGRPDLQGVWTNASITTLERPERYASMILKPEEVEAATRMHPQNVRQRTDDNQKLTDGVAALNGKDLAQGRGYNSFWIDPGTRFGVVNGETRTAWITDPPDGRIPFSAEGRKLARAGEAKLGYSDPEARPLADRCLATGGRTGPPMVNGLYNNHYQIVVTPTHVMILSEMIEHARIIPIGDRHGPKVMHKLFGDSIAHWEGDGLVIETTDFSDYHRWQDHPAYLSADAKVTERFSRSADKELLYEFTVDDPVFYAQPWRGAATWRSDGERIYEYACHEGNYAMAGILQGARVQEARGIRLETANEE
jgi:hypothetical protein